VNVTSHASGPAGLPRRANRLAAETSPYLQQHAGNPVDWYPWGDEPFEVARRSGRPVFLSIGYSTCHWCHVMAEESFEDPEIAEVLNREFVAIKVDREERPDVDAVYMAATQALTGGGGWPMSLWLDHDRRPFLAGTYFPPRDGARGELRGFLSILLDVAEAWKKAPGRVEAVAEQLASAVRVALGGGGARPGAPPGVEVLELAHHLAADSWDERHGGLVGAPKFPSSFPLRAMLRYHRRTHDPKALQMVVRTLEAMDAGGIHDQLGGGFHRYATDGAWRIPHFEKMLYDNALLAVAYAEAWQVTRRPDFARVVRTTLDYLLRDLEAPDGGFCAATDADSEGGEGSFFVWEEAELRRLLGADAARFGAYYGVTPGGNFEGANVLHVPHPDERQWEALAEPRGRLLEARAHRPAPRRDEKRIAAWNGLAISALAFGARVFAEPRWLEAAERTARFVLGPLRSGGRLLRSYAAGRASPVGGFLSDHAFLTQGLIDLYEATFEPRWLEAAIAVADATEERFADRDAGGWFATAADGEALIAREKPTRDGAEPSGASVAALNALRLAAFTVDERWRRIAEGALRAYAPVLESFPAALNELLLAVDFSTDAVREVMLVWPEGEPPPEPFLEVLRQTFLPSRALAGAPEGPALEVLGGLALFAREKRAAGGRPTAYVCERGVCRLPAIHPEKLRAQIEPIRPLR
jgi:uncharacterized protein YyaL (SSP411 family)